jgi:hypothetical protein
VEPINSITTVDEVRNTKRRYARLGFPGSMGCIDCSGVEWTIRPTAPHGVHTGKDGKPVLRMEVLSDDYLRIWRILFGYPGSMNDLSILAHSPLMQKIRNGESPLAIPEVDIGSMTLSSFYFIVDGIYPRHRFYFINSYSKPRSHKEKAFSRQQEGVGKTVERVCCSAQWTFPDFGTLVRTLWEKGYWKHSPLMRYSSQRDDGVQEK